MTISAQLTPPSSPASSRSTPSTARPPTWGSSARPGPTPEDPHASRRHAIIAQRGDGARVLDDRSSDGTRVNGRPVTVGYLNTGDVLRLGRVVLRFVEIPPEVRVRPLRRFRLAGPVRPGRA